MTFPDGVSDVRRLYGAMSRLAPGFNLQPPMQPDSDALDNALLEWRMYPVGDVTGSRWIASYLGQAYIADASLHFRAMTPPVFPFAVLGRTDDGRLWGASPVHRSLGRDPGATASELYSSRDGAHWTTAGRFDGDIGAIGLHDGAVWTAMTVSEADGAGVAVARVGGGTSEATPVGAIYGGEDMFFADVGNGFYLVCGAEPGTRADDGSGPLVALRLDRVTAGLDVSSLLGDRLVPAQATPAPPNQRDAAAFVRPSLDALRAIRPSSSSIGSLVTTASAQCDCRVLTPDTEREFELEYAWVPDPLARVDVQAHGDAATVRRTLERGPLSIDGRLERWSKDANGAWRLTSVVRTWHI